LFLQTAWNDETLTACSTVSADKMMVSAWGPVWHPAQRNEGLIPQGLRGLDRDATWSYSYADGWVYGHGAFCLATHDLNVLGAFKWMPNAASEAKRLGTELGRYERWLKVCCMDSKADDYALYRRLKDKYDIQLLTRPRQPQKVKAPERIAMFGEMQTERHRRLYRQRQHTVEPMQSLVKDLFELEHTWMRGNASNRWSFAAMGVAVQIAQRLAWQANESTWRIQARVLGV